MWIISKEWLGYFSLGAAFLSYVLYFHSIFKGRTKPHAFSWAVWGLLTAIAFYAQYRNDAGAGAWATGLVSAFCFGVAVLALFMGEKDIKKSDWYALCAALTIVPVWYFTKDPLPAVIMVIMIDAVGGYYPTFRKSWYKPQEETVTMYVIGVVQIILSLLAMERYHLVNIIYPLFIIVANGAFVAMVLLRRKSMSV